MKRTQIQLPDPLWKEVNRVAQLQDWSIAEVIRRSAESFVNRYQDKASNDHWTPPAPAKLGPFKASPEKWKELAAEDHERI